MMIGYSRVSTHEQTGESQLDALKAAGCERVYSDCGVSGSKAERPELTKCLDALRDGDTLVVWRLDRYGRSLRHLIDSVEMLKEKGVKFISLHEHIDTTTSTGKLTFNLFACLAEFERELIKERTSASLASARARGRCGGRPEKLSAKEVVKMRALYDARTLSASDIAGMFRISRPTMYRYLRGKKGGTEKQ